MITLNGIEISPTIFPDGTSQVWKLGDLIRPNQNAVKWDFESEDELFHLQQLKILIDETANSFNNQLHIPYLPYARQDKEVTDATTFALRAFSRVLNSMHWNIIGAFDIHSSEATRLIDQLVNIPPDLSFVRDYDFVIFPDQGAAYRYTQLVLTALELDTSRIIVGDKTRDQKTGYITSYNIDVDKIKGKKVIVVDDLCDGGKTFEILGEELIEAKYVTLYVSHGLFSKGLTKLLSIYDKIITTDTCQGAHEWKAIIQDDCLIVKPHLKPLGLFFESGD